MKNKLYILGFISSILIIAGGILKINHIAGAGICLTLGILLLCLIFMPAAVISSYKDGGRKRPVFYIAIFLTIIIDFIGALFKIMHWPGASILMFMGILSPIVIFLPVFLYYHYKDQEESNTNFLYVMFLLVYLSVMSALLAINVSKQIIDQSVISEKISNLNKYYTLKKKINNSNNLPEMAALNEQTTTLLQKINDLKADLVLWGCDENKAAINDQKQINLFYITNKDSYDAPGTILFGKKEAYKLKISIERYRKYLSELAKKEKIDSKLLFNNLLKTKDIQSRNDHNITWEKYTFEELPLVMVIKNLTNVENNVILAESEIISELKQQTTVQY